MRKASYEHGPPRHMGIESFDIPIAMTRWCVALTALPIKGVKVTVS
jgi:hypothetical protein